MSRLARLASVSLDLACHLLPNPFLSPSRLRSLRRMNRGSRRSTRLELERLEDRTMLSATISGNVFNDLSGNVIRQATDPVLAGQTVYLYMNGGGQLNSSQHTVQNTVVAGNTAITGNVPLSDFGAVGSALQVQGLPSTFSDVALNLDLTNNSLDAIPVTLASPLGPSVGNLPLVFDIQPGQHFVGTFDGNSSNPVVVAPTPVPNGTYAPVQSFNTPVYGIEDSNTDGTWGLDFFGSPNDFTTPGQSLVINSWSLTFTNPETSTQTNGSGNYSFTGLAEGMYTVSLEHPGADMVTSPVGSNGSQSVTVLTPNQTVTSVNFGELPAADLTSIAFNLTAPATSFGQNITINYTLQNQGSGNASAFNVGLYLSDNGAISATDSVNDGLLNTGTALNFSGLAAGRPSMVR